MKKMIKRGIKWGIRGEKRGKSGGKWGKVVESGKMVWGVEKIGLLKPSL